MGFGQRMIGAFLNLMSPREIILLSLSLLASLCGIYIGINVSGREAAVFLDLDNICRYLKFVVRIERLFRSQLGLAGR
jgi:hypothetical protein